MNSFRKIRDGNTTMLLKWNEKMNIDWKLRNKENKNAFDLLEDAKVWINNDGSYHKIVDEMTKQSWLVQPSSNV